MDTMKIWKNDLKIEDIGKMQQKSMVDWVGIEFIEVGEDYLKARMPVDRRTIQPFGIMHGGASCVLAETIASVGGHYCIDNEHFFCVGLEINANHIRSVREGYVYGVARPIHLGKTTQVWEIKITNEKEQLVCISRQTLAILKKDSNYQQ